MKKLISKNKILFPIKFFCYFIIFSLENRKITVYIKLELKGFIDSSSHNIYYMILFQVHHDWFFLFICILFSTETSIFTAQSVYSASSSFFKLFYRFSSSETPLLWSHIIYIMRSHKKTDSVSSGVQIRNSVFPLLISEFETTLTAKLRMGRDWRTSINTLCCKSGQSALQSKFYKNKYGTSNLKN